MAGVEIRDVRKNYGAVATIHGVTVDIEDGEFVILVGPSGCGKSTLLRMLAGLEGITGGEMRIGGRVVNDVPPKERDIAMVFQNYALYPHMTVADNMGFSLMLKGMGKAEIRQRIERAAKILSLDALLDRYPRQLSGGQRQRVAMGRAIVRDPQVFLFDEPLSNLDAKLRVQMRAEIKALHGQLGTTTVYVTHDQIEAMTMADKIVVMREGVIEQVGAPLELYDRPANLFVAGFIGSPSMNVLPGRIEAGGFRCGELLLPLPETSAPLVGQEAGYGVRPEHLGLSDEGIPARILIVEPTGSETQVIAEFAGQRITCVFRDRIQARPGDTLRVLPDVDRVHLFAHGSGLRLNGWGDGPDAGAADPSAPDRTKRLEARTADGGRRR